MNARMKALWPEGRVAVQAAEPVACGHQACVSASRLCCGTCAVHEACDWDAPHVRLRLGCLVCRRDFCESRHPKAGLGSLPCASCLPRVAVRSQRSLAAFGVFG